MANDIIRARKPRQMITTMKAVADQGNRGLPPESELRTYEFGNGTIGKKAREYQGTFNVTTGLWE
jgi:hypothetical protein